MQGGADYQNRVAGWFAVKTLAVREGRPFAPSAVLTLIRSETQESGDDLLVGTELGYFEFIQAKRKLSLSALADSDLGSVLSQIVRQLVHQAEPAKRPWSRALDFDHDRFLLVTSSDIPEGIKRDLAIVLKRIFGLAPLQILDDAALTKNEITTLPTNLEHIDREWKKETGKLPAKEEQRYVLKLLDVAVLDVGSGQLGERESIGDLHAGVLRDPAQEHLAIVSACKETTILRTWLDVATLRKILREDHILLQHEWPYRTDIAALARHPQSILDLLSDNSRIQVIGNTIKIERDVVSELLKGSEIDSLVLVGQPRAGKSGVIYELALRLQSKGVILFP